jgi:hypothetical protein
MSYGRSRHVFGFGNNADEIDDSALAEAAKAFRPGTKLRVHPTYTITDVGGAASPTRSMMEEMGVDPTKVAFAASVTVNEVLPEDGRYVTMFIGRKEEPTRLIGITDTEQEGRELAREDYVWPEQPAIKWVRQRGQEPTLVTTGETGDSTGEYQIHREFG